MSLFATQPDDGVRPLLDRFAAATSSIEYAPFSLDDQRITQALGAARSRGVQVRVLLEPAPGDDEKDGDRARTRLEAVGVDVRPSNPAFELTHAKYAVIDEREALILTFNSVGDDLDEKRDFGLADHNSENVRFVRSLFDADWERASLNQIPAGFVISPDNSTESLVQFVDSATGSLDIYAEKLQASPLLDAIGRAMHRGVNVRILAAPMSSKTPGLSGLQLAGMDLRPAVRILQNSDVHAKVIIVDNSVVFFGSENVEDSAGEGRRELGIIFSDSTITSQLHDTFERDWASPTKPLK